MLLADMPKHYQLIYSISDYTFSTNKVRCAVFVSKTPYLSALIACHGAKVNIDPPFNIGTCMLLPLQSADRDIYSHVVVSRIDELYGSKIYYLKVGKERNNSKNPLGLEGRPSSFVEKNALVFPTSNENDWLGKHDVPSSKLMRYANVSHPAIIGQKHIVNHWKNIPLNLPHNQKLTMSDILELSSKNNVLDCLDIYSVNNRHIHIHNRQIWVNSVPNDLNEKTCLIILSPSHALFEDNILELNQLYSNEKLEAIKQHDVNKNLNKLGVTSRSLSIVSLLKSGAI